MSKPKIHLVGIDPQNDFTIPGAPLYVKGAENDMNALAKFIAKYGDDFEDIHITLDSHHEMHIAHGNMWRDKHGNQPGPFTVITVDDMENGTWLPYHDALFTKFKDYLVNLKTGGRYDHMIWPEHCIIGTDGHSVHKDVRNVLSDWARTNKATIDFVTKGSNVYTEHFSAVRAEVEDPDDLTTSLNTDFIDTLSEADIIYFTGEALSHCVANTIKDICDNFGEENIKKIWLLEDTTSNVENLEFLGQQFLDEMIKRGMNMTTTDKAFTQAGV